MPADTRAASIGQGDGGRGPRVDWIANARLPSRRAQGLQVVRMAGALAGCGAQVRLLHAERHPTPSLPPGVSLFENYGVTAQPQPQVLAVPCWDYIDRTPSRLQYLPARLQELTFARNAARAVQAAGTGLVLTRELETARHLVRAGHRGTFLELHRVPGGRTRTRWLREALAGVRGAIAISGGVAEDLVALGLDGDRLLIEHDAADLAPFDGRTTRAAARSRLGVGTESPLVVYAGSLLPWKGVEILIDAAGFLPEVEFLVAGGSPEEVERLARRSQGSGNIRLDGHQDPTRIPDYLIAADVFCVPNRSQPAISARYTSPLKVFEAMASGVPMVVSDLPSLRDILHGDEAEFVAPDSATALAAGIRTLVEDPHRRYQMSKRLRIRAPKHSWEGRARRILNWMETRVEGGAA